MGSYISAQKETRTIIIQILKPKSINHKCWINLTSILLSKYFTTLILLPGLYHWGSAKTGFFAQEATNGLACLWVWRHLRSIIRKNNLSNFVINYIDEFNWEWCLLKNFWWPYEPFTEEGECNSWRIPSIIIKVQIFSTISKVLGVFNKRQCNHSFQR